MERAEALLDFWLREVGPKGWYRSDDALDGRIRRDYEALWQEGREPGHLGWSSEPRSSLALVILLDQFPRNMFRGSSKAYASDGRARAVAKKSIERKWDCRADEPERQFFYLPLMHAETLFDQDRSVRLIQDRMPRTGADNLLHARAHREVIRRFGRFPHRNDDLGRQTRDCEAAFLQQGGYSAVVAELREAA